MKLRNGNGSGIMLLNSPGGRPCSDTRGGFVVPGTDNCSVLQSSMQCNVGCVGSDPSPEKYPVCGERRQSPVDIELTSTVFGSEYTSLEFHGYDATPDDVSFTLANKEHTGLYSDKDFSTF